MSFIPLKVQFDIRTPDNLRAIILTLESAPQNDNFESWTIDFELWERAHHMSALQIIAKISVELGQADFGGARTIAQTGLCTAQRAEALVVADAVKDYEKDGLSIDKVREAVINIVRVE